MQQRVLAGYATMQGLTIDRMFVERGVSGSRPLGDRPEGGALLAVEVERAAPLEIRLATVERKAPPAIDGRHLSLPSLRPSIAPLAIR